MKKSTINSRILHMFIVLNVLLLCVVVSMTYFELVGKESLMSNNYNRRLKAYEDGIIRGEILDRNGQVLAYSEMVEGISKRVYPYKRLYSHVIGYSNDRLGKTLLEAKYNEMLLGKNALGLMGNTISLVTGEDKTGNNLILTIDHDLQTRARELLGDNRGAIVALNPKTGEILAMVSTPDYNPNESALLENWDALSTDGQSPLLPRAVRGLYPPGSTFKVVTAIAALESGHEAFTVDDQGSIVIDGKIFANAYDKVYGPLDMTTAMAVSSNVYFTALTTVLDSKDLIKSAEKAGINRSIDFDLATSTSKVGKTIESKTEYAATTIGQGQLLVTPLQMALIGAGIANEGTIMKPYLVKSISDRSDVVLTTTKDSKLYQLTDATTADRIKEMMVEVVKSGTGKKAAISEVTVAGKTGTAQNEKSSLGSGYDHAWFIGFAPAEAPEIAIAVIVENHAEDGGQIAAPIARKIMSLWIKELNH